MSKKDTPVSKQELFGLLRLLSALESILLSHKVPTPDYLFEAMGASVDALEREILAEDSDFKEAVLDELVSLHASVDGSARDLVQKAIELNCQIVTDPAVSDRAKGLVAQGLQLAAQICKTEGERGGFIAGWPSCVEAIEREISHMRALASEASHG